MVRYFFGVEFLYFRNTFAKYTKSLRGSIAKAKANAAQVIGKMIVIATNKRWIENKNEKHKKDA